MREGGKKIKRVVNTEREKRVVSAVDIFVEACGRGESIVFGVRTISRMNCYFWSSSDYFDFHLSFKLLSNIGFAYDELFISRKRY